jgi:hypothetical protein
MLFDYLLIPEGCDVYRKRGNNHNFRDLVLNYFMKGGNGQIFLGIIHPDPVQITHHQKISIGHEEGNIIVYGIL